MTPTARDRIDRGLVSGAALLFALPVLLVLSQVVQGDALRGSPFMAFVDMGLTVVAFAGPPVGGGVLGYRMTRRDARGGRPISAAIVVVAASVATAAYFLTFGSAPTVEVLYLYMIWAVYIAALVCALIGASCALWLRGRAPKA